MQTFTQWLRFTSASKLEPQAAVHRPYDMCDGGVCITQLFFNQAFHGNTADVILPCCCKLRLGQDTINEAGMVKATNALCTNSRH